ncbi:MBL fold metallo-hydrolase [Burkholderia vietnamiensis]|uniref:ComEC/Rec2 family competence protein n=1 Tax=Burkholderia TaxID=32008 RepID=UPI000BBB5C91|nr:MULTISPECIES: MBL fold metallo-hydrolase [Burkholderia]AXK68262.1 MBL fold metallo-hydrolase [Burkholderia sp. IDO3]MBR7912039.1 MBL fold metallo-hydrolase [Burkholderia vietnamiensis]MBR8001695.1 MBL fold metallo-hydrolase [Burkholderia vietnamiensis]MCA7947217.1 MBL fold metallo-hydrolase [Burkholderia vietnamiensis]MDN7554862.1 MBL fold metallo-hydrolase [Burkholderia vietnamiensis]
MKHSLTIVDVSHGNCAILEDGDKVVVFDAASGASLLQYLEKENISTVDAVFISHSDEDHISGLVALLASGSIDVTEVHLNPDAAKNSRIWGDLVKLLDQAHCSGKTKVFTSIVSGRVETETLERSTVEILSPSRSLALKGAGSRDEDERKITSNSMSAVFRILWEGHPTVLLCGDMDQVTLKDIVRHSCDLSCDFLVFPHHGGNPGTSGDVALLRFIELLCNSAKAKTILFSNGRGKHDNPRPDVIAGVRRLTAGVEIMCTQLSQRCSADAPRAIGHLSERFSAGAEKNACCSGSVTIDLSASQIDRPARTAHLNFVRNLPSPLCIPAVPRLPGS